MDFGLLAPRQLFLDYSSINKDLVAYFLMRLIKMFLQQN